MSLSPFDLHQKGIRLVKHQNSVYKVKVIFSGIPEKISSSLQEAANDEFEQVFRAVLYAQERDKHFGVVETDNFFVSISKTYWKASEKLCFKENGHSLKVFPHVLVFNISLKKDENLSTNQETDRTRMSLKETRDLREKSSQENPALKRNRNMLKESLNRQDTTDRTVRQKKQVGKDRSEDTEHVEITSQSKRLRLAGNIQDSSFDNEQNVVVSPERWLRSVKQNKIRSPTTRSQSQRVTSQTTVVKRKTPTSCRTINVRQKQECANRKRNLSTLDITTMHNVKRMPTSDNSKLKRQKIKSVSPTKMSIRELRQQNKNNSNLEADNVDVIQTRKAVRLLRNDRHMIESEDYVENMKLQLLASSSSSSRSPRRRRSSGFLEFIETLTTPLKHLIMGK